MICGDDERFANVSVSNHAGEASLVWSWTQKADDLLFGVTLGVKQCHTLDHESKNTHYCMEKHNICEGNTVAIKSKVFNSRHYIVQT